MPRGSIPGADALLYRPLFTLFLHRATSFMLHPCLPHHSRLYFLDHRHPMLPFHVHPPFSIHRLLMILPTSPHAPSVFYPLSVSLVVTSHATPYFVPPNTALSSHLLAPRLTSPLPCTDFTCFILPLAPLHLYILFFVTSAF